MRLSTLAAIVAGIAVLTAGSRAATAKRVHRSPAAYVGVPTPQDPVRNRLNYFGNAAAEGNNANSMSGSNSAGDNAIGRTSGGGFH